MTAPRTAPAPLPEVESPDVLTADDAMQALADQGREDRLWLRAIPGVLAELRALDESETGRVSERVRFSRDQAAIALMERLGRLARRDLSS